MKIKLILDRTEGKTAVFTDNDGNIFECDISLLKEGFSEDDMFIADMLGSKIISLERTENLNAGENLKRLNGMFRNK